MRKGAVTIRPGLPLRRVVEECRHERASHPCVHIFRCAHISQGAVVVVKGVAHDHRAQVLVQIEFLGYSYIAGEGLKAVEHHNVLQGLHPRRADDRKYSPPPAAEDSLARELLLVSPVAQLGFNLFLLCC